MYHFQRVRLAEAQRIAEGLKKSDEFDPISDGWEGREVTEDLATKAVDPKQFPNPLPREKGYEFLTKGLRDGQPNDDQVKAKNDTIPAKDLKPSQMDIYLSKALGMAIGGVKGGNLAAIISLDNHILDGHHRWAATMFADPSAKVTGIRIGLAIGDLIPVLRSVGDAYGNPRRGAPSGDISIYDASDKDVIDAVVNGKGMDPKFYNKDKADTWLKSIGGEAFLIQRFRALKATRPPSGAPNRINMPVIDAEKNQHIKAATAMGTGKIDVMKPYGK